MPNILFVMKEQDMKYSHSENKVVGKNAFRLPLTQKQSWHYASLEGVSHLYKLLVCNE